MKRPALLVILLCALATAAAKPPPPIIDMHLHALDLATFLPAPIPMCVAPPTLPRRDPADNYGETFARFKLACATPIQPAADQEALLRETLEILERRNIHAVVSGTPDLVAAWREAAPSRLMPGLMLSIDADTPSPEALRALHARGELAVLGEVVTQYQGILPDDARLAPYWALAEELDIPVAIHVGTGPPGVAYLGSPGYRGRMHSALTMEEVLVRHPRLRVYLMHAGFPMLDDMLTLMYAHPQVYVDVGVIAVALPRAQFWRYLERIFEAGFGDRVMFGSDQMVWPGTIEVAISAIEEAPFLSEAQKRDLLYQNAARFLRLDEAEIARHHGRNAESGLE
jgi:predicted TIM-barrel fold metal-dependent hydrolase